jgi:hypothetical protein
MLGIVARALLPILVLRLACLDGGPARQSREHDYRQHTHSPSSGETIILSTD